MILSVNHSSGPTITPGAPLLLEITIRNGAASRAVLATATRVTLQQDLDAQVNAHVLTRQQADAQLKRRSIPAPVTPVVVTVGAAGFSFSGAGPSAATPLPWRPKIVAPASPIRVTLEDTQVSSVTFVVAPDETASTPKGTYGLRAVFEQRASDQWQGRITSNEVTVSVADPPAAPSVSERKRQELLRGEYFLILKDHDRAIAAAREILSLDPQSIDGSLLLGEAQEAKGDLHSALDAYEAALMKFRQRHPHDHPPLEVAEGVSRLRGKVGIQLKPFVENP